MDDKIDDIKLNRLYINKIFNNIKIDKIFMI